MPISGSVLADKVQVDCVKYTNCLLKSKSC